MTEKCWDEAEQEFGRALLNEIITLAEERCRAAGYGPSTAIWAIIATAACLAGEHGQQANFIHIASATASEMAKRDAVGTA